MPVDQILVCAAAIMVTRLTTLCQKQCGLLYQHAASMLTNFQPCQDPIMHSGPLLVHVLYLGLHLLLLLMLHSMSTAILHALLSRLGLSPTPGLLPAIPQTCCCPDQQQQHPLAQGPIPRHLQWTQHASTDHTAGISCVPHLLYLGKSQQVQRNAEVASCQARHA